MAETITMPKLGFDMQEGTLIRWLRSEGESIDKGDVLAEIETDKATVEVELSATGIIRRLLVDQGAIVPIGTPIAIVGTKDEKIEVPTDTGGATKRADANPPKVAASVQTAAPTPAVPPNESGAAGMVKASPLARKMAGEAGIDLRNVPASGPGGRVVRRDIEAALVGRGAASGLPAPYLRQDFFGTPRPDVDIPLSRLRAAIGRRMTELKSNVPHFYVTHEYRADALMDLRQQANSILPEDEKLSVNDFVVKATALCLREFPNLNSAFLGDHLVRRGAVNIGVAVAVEGGLLTVVCRDADLKPLRQISQEVKDMAARVRGGKVRSEDIEGSTFSVSNLGMYGVDNFAAIINPPEAGILAVGAARRVPVVENGGIKAAWSMKATIAVDHRVSDGAEAARFMQALARYLEAPVGMFL